MATPRHTFIDVKPGVSVSVNQVKHISRSCDDQKCNYNITMLDGKEYVKTLPKNHQFGTNTFWYFY